MELIEQLGLEVTAESDISEAQKALVRERILNEPAAEYLTWEEARKQLKAKKG